MWKDVMDFDGVFAAAYHINGDGELWSKDRYIIYKDGSKHLHKGKKIKPVIDNNGYCVVTLTLNGYRIKVSYHKLVANAFPEICGEWFPGAEVDHIDGNPSNNRPENLKYKDHKGNVNNPITRERMSKSKTNNTYNVKPVYQFTKDGTFVAEYPSVMEAERQTGIANTSISDCCRKKVKKDSKGFYYTTTSAGGYIWKYCQTG